MVNWTIITIFSRTAWLCSRKSFFFFFFLAYDCTVCLLLFLYALIVCQWFENGIVNTSRLLIYFPIYSIRVQWTTTTVLYTTTDNYGNTTNCLTSSFVRLPIIFFFFFFFLHSRASLHLMYVYMAECATALSLYSLSLVMHSCHRDTFLFFDTRGSFCIIYSFDWCIL